MAFFKGIQPNLREFQAEYMGLKVASTTTTQKIIDLNSNITNIKTQMENLNTEETFAGPICDSVVSGWETIYPNLLESVVKLEAVPTFLDTTAVNYQTSDKTNADNIGGVM